MISLNLIKSDDEMWIDIRKFDNFWKEDSKTNLRNQKSLNLDQDSWGNHRMNMREIYEIKIREKLSLKLTQITIQKWNLKLYEYRLGWNPIPNPRLRSNWSNYSPDSRLFIKIQKTQSLMIKRQFLPRLSTKSHSQALCGCENECRSNWK